MTPLIDVVFLLIIFFLVSSHLARQETQLELDLPTASSGHQETPGPTARVTINLLPDGRYLLGSNEVALAELRSRLQVESQETAGDLEVRLRADRHLAYRHVEPVLMACAKAKIWNVSFAVFPRP
jgi:biopolymer transport protein ExbD